MLLKKKYKFNIFNRASQLLIFYLRKGAQLGLVY